MKKLISLSLALMLLLGVLAVPALADGAPIGTLSFLNMTEEEVSYYGVSSRRSMMKLLYLNGVLTGEEFSNNAVTYRYYDTLNALLMALQAGELDGIKVPYYTGKYLCSTNDGLKLMHDFHPEKVSEAVQLALSVLSDGYAFMMKEENAELRDAFDAQITAMKEDGTLQKLIDEHIVKMADGGEPVAVAFEKFEGDPIKVAVTGSLPPIDYVAPDGSFAGFNTAVLAEIGKRLQKNIELVQVDSVGRALALSEGTVDAVFWTRSLSETLTERHIADAGFSEEEQEARIAERREQLTDEEKAILEDNKRPDKEAKAKMDARDMPAGTIITQPYFTDFPVIVSRK